MERDICERLNTAFMYVQEQLPACLLSERLAALLWDAEKEIQSLRREKERLIEEGEWLRSPPVDTVADDRTLDQLLGIEDEPGFDAVTESGQMRKIKGKSIRKKKKK